MIKTLGWIRIAFLALFAVLTAATWAYQVMVLQPRRTCIENGGWWQDEQRVCGIPVSVSRFTGRPNAAARTAPVAAAPGAPIR